MATSQRKRSSRPVPEPAAPSRGLAVLDTSAQIRRVFGSTRARNYIEATAASCVPATTTHIRREFAEVVGGCYRLLHAALNRQPPGQFEISELWRMATETVRQSRIPGGPKHLSEVGMSVYSAFHGRQVEARTVANWMLGQHDLAMRAFFLFGTASIDQTRMADCTSCCHWETGGSPRCRVEPVPARCRLKSCSLDQRDYFEQTVATVAASRAEESAGIADALRRLQVAAGVKYLAIICRRPNQFGDVLIFHEIPVGALFVTFDRLFGTLLAAHPKDVQIALLTEPMHRPSSPDCQFRRPNQKKWHAAHLLAASPAQAEVRVRAGVLPSQARSIVLKAAGWDSERLGTIQDRQPGPEGDLLRVYFPLRQVWNV